MAENGYLIGVDTGGTYTDAAVIRAADNKVVASAKALTTRGNLAIGVSEAIASAVAALPQSVEAGEVRLVSVSTTLATNAVVEGHGSTVGVILIGFDDRMVTRTGIVTSFSGNPIARVGGGHNHNGDEVCRFDVAAVEAQLDDWGDRVDAVAIASQFAVRNPAHEHLARDVVISRTAKPVTISSELSSALDAPRRALTAVLNARLISRIALLIDAVRASMDQHGIAAPLMIVKGDGTLALAETVAKRPIETILSGPAASLVGAASLSRLNDFIMSDMGGTTTDIGILEAGRPRVSETGAEVGGWRTMVKAIDVRTIGLGGDSEVLVSMAGEVSLGPRRVVPISLIASRFSEVMPRLEAELADTMVVTAPKFVMLPLGSSSADVGTRHLNNREMDILELVTDRPQPIAAVASGSGAQRTIGALQRKGLVQVAGFTPSDAAHVLGLQANWSREAAVVAARQISRLRPGPMDAKGFSEAVWNEAVRLTGQAILTAALDDESAARSQLVDAVCRGDGHLGLTDIRVSPRVPVVAVGGPVKVFYPEVGRRLNAEMVFPDHCEVGNAVGAATSLIARQTIVEVSGDGNGRFHVHSTEGPRLFAAAADALSCADELARNAARAAVLEMGGLEPEISVTVDKLMLPDAVDDNGLLHAKITAEAVARPLMPGN